MIEKSTDPYKQQEYMNQINDLDNLIGYYQGRQQLQFKMINSSFNCSVMVPAIQGNSSGVQSVMDLDQAVDAGKLTLFAVTARIDS